MEDAILSRFAKTLDSPDAVPSAEDVSILEAAYPYFILPAAVRLERAKQLSNQERLHLERRVALSVSNPGTLFRLVDVQGKLFDDFYPHDSKPSAPTTDSAITTFLETYGKSDPREDEILTKLIFNPVAEYAATLEIEEQDSTPEAADSQDALMDAFLKRYEPSHHAAQERNDVKPQAQVKETPQARVVTKKADEDSLLSESLAKIYISRGRYDKAYEIIHNLSLNFPKKSIYFADQLRFLQKLIVNSKYKDK
ncbi:MAG: hypothetical protein K2I18_07720 [Paramuribaculum sp.]|nr:hypothetical protein [Paramuribaculum sp.]